MDIALFNTDYNGVTYFGDYYIYDTVGTTYDAYGFILFFNATS